MFLGHCALGFGAKKIAPSVSLGTFFLAAQFADLLWPNLVLLGVERFSIEPGITAVTPLNFTWYPYSHSLIALAVWGTLFALVYFFARGRKVKAAIVVGALVVSHWVLDFIVHRPDLPLTLTGTPRFGLGIWNSVYGTLAAELALFIVGVLVYARTTVARDRIGRYSFWALVGFLFVISLANMFGPPPPSVPAVAWSAQAMWLLVAWGYWIDRHHAVRIDRAPSELPASR